MTAFLGLMQYHVPVAEVNCDNITRIWPYMISSIQKSQIIAIDLELSGLGKRMGCKQIFSDRYKEVKEAADTRTILSVGIATFQPIKDAEHPRQLAYKCKIFDLISLEMMPFVVEPEALTFLSSHGFDFNRLLSHGIKYSKAKLASRENIFKSLWEEILASGVSIALHNGLNDLAFLHEHFYASLPNNPDQFIANISDWFGENDGNKMAGPYIWDTKYLASQNPKFASSYLEYVFRKTQRENHRRMESSVEPSIAIKFSRFRKSIRREIPFSKVDISLTNDFLTGKIADIQSEQLCTSYKDYGHCHNRSKCSKDHDVDLTLDLEDRKIRLKREKDKRRREKLKKNQEEEQNQATSTLERAEVKKLKRKQENKEENHAQNKKSKPDGKGDESEEKSHVDGCNDNNPTDDGQSVPVGKFATRGRHRSGMDAFMTGFAALYFNADHAHQNNGALDANCAGRVPLPGKDIPLILKKRDSDRQSESHILNWARIKSRRSGFEATKASGK